MQHWNVPKQDSGFTLIEMLAVTIIIGIVAAVAVPNLLGLLNNARVTDGVADVEGAIKEAKRQAIRFSQRCVIEIATTTGSDPRAIVRPAPTVGGNNNRCLLEQRVLPEGVVVTDDIPNTIEISSKGNIGNTSDYTPPGNGNWTITVSHNNAGTSKCLRVEGLFGDVQTGIIQGGVCNTNL